MIRLFSCYANLSRFAHGVAKLRRGNVMFNGEKKKPSRRAIARSPHYVICG
jgi:hypothetical protein